MMILGGKTAQACDHPALPSENPMWTLLASCWAGDANVRPSMADVIEQVGFLTCTILIVSNSRPVAGGARSG